MKRPTALLLLGGLLLVGQSFAHKKKDAGEFSLTVHITAVDMQQGERGVSGSGSTDSEGKYSSSTSGGGSYTWHLYTAKIDGDKIVYALRSVGHRGGNTLAKIRENSVFARRNASLHIGDYAARWEKDGTLEIQFTNEKGELEHQTFSIETETAPVVPAVAPSPAPSATPVAYQQQNEGHIESATQPTQTSPQPVRTEENLGDAARSAKQRKACLELAKDNPSIACK